MYDLLIQNVTVVDPGAARLRVLENHDVAIAGGRIAAIQPAGQLAPGEAGEVIDGGGMAALPGLINTHAHAAMVLFRGAAEDVTIDAWFNDYIWPMETNLTPEDVYWGALLAAAEMIAGGVTTVADHYFAMDSVARAIAESGMRGHLAPTMFGQNPRAELDEASAFAARWHGAAGGRITAWLGPHSPYLCPPEFLREVAAEARGLGLGCHIHVSETALQVEQNVERYGATPIRLLAQVGLLDSPLLCAHAAHATAEEIGLLAASNAGVAHCPKTFLKLAAGIAPISEMLRRGVAVGVGSDGAASNNTLDMLEQLRLAAMLQKHELRDPAALKLDQALRLATDGGARVLGQPGRIGRLESGALADVILLRLDGPHVQPLHDPAAAIVYSARAGDVDTTIVDGKVLMRGRKLLTLDLDLILREVRGRVARLRERGHGRRLQTY